MKLSQDLNVGDKVFKAGTECPSSEEERLILHNPDYLELEYEAGIPILKGKDLEKYGKYFKIEKTKMKIKPKPYSQTGLLEKLNKVGFKEFKEWAETTFGEEKIDKRKKSKAIINDILAIQERDRQ